MNIDSINSGIVLDHIPAGRGMEIYRYLKLDRLKSSVAIIQNAKSRKLGHKDIIKIDEAIDVNLDMLGYIGPGITVNVIKDGVRIDKRVLDLPERLINVLKCKNPRCITTVEPELDHVFRLADKTRGIYRCEYCDEKMSAKALGE